MRRLLTILILLLFIPSTVTANSAIDGATNALRQSAGLAPLTVNKHLEALATQRAYEIQPPNFYHTDLRSRIKVCFSSYGENIQYSGLASSSNPITFYNGWYNSAPHKANMLGDWTHMGSAHVRVGGYWFGVQIFIKANCTIPNTSTSDSTGQIAIVSGLVLSTIGIRLAAHNRRQKVARYAIIKKDRSRA